MYSNNIPPLSNAVAIASALDPLHLSLTLSQPHGNGSGQLFPGNNTDGINFGLGLLNNTNEQNFPISLTTSAIQNINNETTVYYSTYSIAFYIM